MLPVSRRDFLATSAGALAGGLIAADISAGEDALPAEFLDTHTHFYDPARPQGVPWPGKNDKLLYRRVLPEDLRKVTGPGLAGTIVVEASPWIEDNQWVLDRAAEDKLIVGLVGRLAPGSERFAADLARFAKNPLFRGLRTSHGDFQKGASDAGKTKFLADLKLLSERDLTLDVNLGPDLLADLARVVKELPDLKVVVNHMAGVKIDGKEPPADWLRGLEAVARQPRVYLKVSALVEYAVRPAGQEKAPTDAAFYKPVLDAVWNLFGAERLLFASNWPVSERFASYREVERIPADYFRGRGAEASAQFFVRNSRGAYGWKPR
jgi:L-fuconolactonase